MSTHLFTLGTIIILLTVILHVSALALIAAVLNRYSEMSRRLPDLIRFVSIIIICIFGVILIHVVEAWIWAAIYMMLGEFDSISDALYFSLVTATTLGYGDLTLSPEWRLLSTFEAMGGLILFGASTAFLMTFMRFLLNADE